jgi:hypothetical protein
MSSVLSYHKEQRQKEIKKNKAKRIAERDAKVAESASLHDIQTQINKLEKQKTYQNGHLDNKDVRKLERLQKELKIVKASEEERKKKAEEKAKLEWEQEKKRMSTKEGVDELNAQKFKKAKASVYYDAVLNPFGAPPPGQPMMYHKRGGGTTMNIREASIPQHLRSGDVDDTDEEDLYMHPSSHQKLNSKQEYQRDDHQTFQRIELKRETVPPPISSKPPPPPPAAPLPSQKVPTKPIETKKSSGTPILPPPSESVQRLNKKGKNKKALDADIWASTDELLYEGNLEGVHDETKDKQEPQYPNKKRRKVDADEERFDPLCPADEGYGEYRSSEQIKRSTTAKKKKDAEGGTKKCSWYYIDQGENIQGPFSSEQMFGWREVGFFPDNTMVRNGTGTEFVEISSVDLMTGELLHVGNEPSQSIEDRIAMLRAEHLETVMDKEGGGVDVRIAALRAELQPEVEGGEENEENDELVGPMYHPESVSVDNDDEQHFVAGPVVVDDEGVPSYPHVDTADEPYYEYPVPDDEENESIPYPVDIDYPVDEFYPDTDSAYAPYPNTDAAFDGNGDEEESVPYYYGSSFTGTNEDQVKVQKQVYTGDSAVVKMVPSNIRNRRQKIGKPKKTIIKKGDDQPKPIHDHKPLTDDYEEFMLEVQALK